MFILFVLNGNEIRIVIFGKMGVGKSVIGNIIFGGKFFKFEFLVLLIIGKCK